MHTYIHVYKHTYIHTYLLTYMYIYTHLHTHMHTYIHMCIQIHTHLRLRIIILPQNISYFTYCCLAACRYIMCDCVLLGVCAYMYLFIYL